MKLAVGSTNPTKIAAVKNVIVQHFPEMEIVGIEVASGVAEQPKNEEGAGLLWSGDRGTCQH